MDTNQTTPRRGPVLHEVKTVRQHFQAHKRGDKVAEVRVNDRDYQVGDYLRQREIIDNPGEKEPVYTGEAVLDIITHVLPGGQYGIDSNTVVLSLRMLAVEQLAL